MLLVVHMATLLVKPVNYDDAVKLFEDTDVTVTKEGVNVLGSTVGSQEFVKSVILDVWYKKLKILAGIGLTQPQSAYSAFTHVFFGEWTYLFRTCDFDECLLKPLEECMRQAFIPSLLGRDAVNALERSWLSLPTRCGGMGLYNPVALQRSQRTTSKTIIGPLVDLLLSDEKDMPVELFELMSKLKKECVRSKDSEYKQVMDAVKSQLPPDKVRLFDVSVEKGASTWLTALPLREFNFDLNKCEFRDAICLSMGGDQ